MSPLGSTLYGPSLRGCNALKSRSWADTITSSRLGPAGPTVLNTTGALGSFSGWPARTFTGPDWLLGYSSSTSPSDPYSCT